jgi:hypothetical protein
VRSRVNHELRVLACRSRRGSRRRPATWCPSSCRISPRSPEPSSRSNSVRLLIASRPPRAASVRRRISVSKTPAEVHCFSGCVFGKNENTRSAAILPITLPPRHPIIPPSGIANQWCLLQTAAKSPEPSPIIPTAHSRNIIGRCQIKSRRQAAVMSAISGACFTTAPTIAATIAVRSNRSPMPI